MDHHHLMQILSLLAVALVFAKLMGGLADRIGIPSVLAELGTGIFIGNIGGDIGAAFGILEASPLVFGLQEMGVLFLLFLVGLETDIKEIGKVGVDATNAAILGVVAPFALAFLALPLFFKSSFEHNLFIAAALTATSVGITARVLQEAGQLKSLSGQVILGAAVIDDILGVIVLTIVTALATSGAFSGGALAILLGKVAAFGVGIYVVRHFVIERVLRGVHRLEVPGTVTIILLGLCLLFAFLAESVGLAGIIGAFALGIILDDVHFTRFREMSDDVGLEAFLKPVTDFFTPIFFIYMGMGVKIPLLMNPEALGLGVVLIICGLIGKQVCGLGLRKSTISRGGDRLLVGFGMIPRGEVGLIFAAIGQQNGILNDADYAAVVLMVAVTTLAAPFLIAWRAKKLTPVSVPPAAAA